MTQKFSSKEIHFLKADSDDVDLKPPQTFFSDLLFDKPAGIEQFEKRLAECQIPGDNFLCATFHIDFKMDDQVAEKASSAFEETFNALLDHERGIWETITDDAIALAFWDYKRPQNAISVIESIQNKLSQTLETDILVGVAQYPYHDFKKEDIFANSLKAIDHAAFFGPSTLFEFDAVSLNICADRRYQLDQFDLAIDDYKKGLEIAPRDANLMNSLGVCHGILNELPQAKEMFKKAIKTTPDDAMIIYNIGLIYMIEDKLDKAIIYLRKAHGADSQVFEVQLLLGQLLFKSELHNQAQPHLETAAKLNPDSGLASRFLGEIFLEKEDFEIAAQYFNSAIKANPSDAVSLSGYAKSLEAQDKNLQIALSFARNSVALEPDNSLFKERLNLILEKLDLLTGDQQTVKTA